MVGKRVSSPGPANTPPHHHGRVSPAVVFNGIRRDLARAWTRCHQHCAGRAAGWLIAAAQPLPYRSRCPGGRRALRRRLTTIGPADTFDECRALDHPRRSTALHRHLAAHLTLNRALPGSPPTAERLERRSARAPEAMHGMTADRRLPCWRLIAKHRTSVDTSSARGGAGAAGHTSGRSRPAADPAPASVNLVENAIIRHRMAGPRDARPDGSGCSRRVTPGR
jgi:hypothetical protein